MSATFLDWVQLSTLLALQSDTCRVWNMNMNVCVGRYTEYGYCCCITFVAVLKQLSQSFSSLRILNLPSWKMKGQRSQPKQVSCQNFALKVKPSPVMTWTRHRCTMYSQTAFSHCRPWCTCHTCWDCSRCNMICRTISPWRRRCPGWRRGGRRSTWDTPRARSAPARTWRSSSHHLDIKMEGKMRRFL